MNSDWFKDTKFTEGNDSRRDWYEKKLLLSDSEIAHHVIEYGGRYEKLQKEFREKSSLTKLDIKIMIFAAALQCLRWAFISNDYGRFSKASDGDNITSRIGEYLPADIESLLSDHTVPYDAIRRSERFKQIYPDFSTGISGTNHRWTTLGHDPLAGWIFGTANIITNTLTVNNMSELFPSYHIREQQFYGKTTLPNVIKWSVDISEERPEILGMAFLKQALHFSTDVFTRQGLPLPIVNTLSTEASQFLIGNGIDFYSVTRGIALSTIIDKLVGMFHRLFFDQYSDDKNIYEVRNKKVIMYSNTFSSILNIAFVGYTGNLGKLDIGGIAKTLWVILNNEEKIRKIEMEFIQKTLDGDLKKEEDEINQRLANYGFKI